jgi:NTP pyrophosphatase (non-canonical NTP hydrolase)
MSYPSVELNVIQWAQKNGIAKASAEVQALKTMSELGELADCIIKRDSDGIEDEMGDVIVTLIVLCDILKIDMTTCAKKAYDKIKNRTGKKLDNGVFIKD